MDLFQSQTKSAISLGNVWAGIKEIRGSIIKVSTRRFPSEMMEPIEFKFENHLRSDEIIKYSIKITVVKRSVK